VRGVTPPLAGAMGNSYSVDTAHVVLPSQVAAGGGEVDKSDDALERAFDQIDVDGSGSIDERELRKAVSRMYGRGLSEEIVKDMMKAGDVNADGL
jgi:Ca2+-binding EF-hand superfamily protein